MTSTPPTRTRRRRPCLVGHELELRHERQEAGLVLGVDVALHAQPGDGAVEHAGVEEAVAEASAAAAPDRGLAARARTVEGDAQAAQPAVPRGACRRRAGGPCPGEPVALGGGQGAHAAGRQVVEPQRPDAHAHEPFHGRPDGREHAPQLTPPALRQHGAVPGQRGACRGSRTSRAVSGRVARRRPTSAARPSSSSMPSPSARAWAGVERRRGARRRTRARRRSAGGAAAAPSRRRR